MKYIVVKSIVINNSLPIKGVKLPSISLSRGEVILSDDPKYYFLDFEDENYFEKVPNPLLDVHDEVLYYPTTKSKPLLGKCTKVYQDNKRYELNFSGKTHTVTIKDKFSKPTYFWFINSNGIITKDYEERLIKEEDKNGLIFKKKIGNCFYTKDDAIKYKNELILNGNL